MLTPYNWSDSEISASLCVITILSNKLRQSLTIMLVKRSIDFIHDVEAVRFVFLHCKIKSKRCHCLFATTQASNVHEALSCNFDVNVHAAVKWLFCIFQMQEPFTFRS